MAPPGACEEESVSTASAVVAPVFSFVTVSLLAAGVKLESQTFTDMVMIVKGSMFIAGEAGVLVSVAGKAGVWVGKGLESDI